MADLFSQQFGQGVRTSTDSIDELVQRNIQEVLQAVNDDDNAGGSSGPTDPVGSKFVAKSSSSRLPRQSSGLGASVSGRAEPAAADYAPAAGAGKTNSTSMLDVPGHAEATIRLHKARIKCLEDDVSKLGKTLAEKDKALTEAQRDAKAMRAEQVAWAKEKKALEAQVERLQKRASEAEGLLANKDQAVKEISKQSSMVERERRNAEAEAKARDVRLQRALEDVERYKQMVQEARVQEREGKDVAKSDFNRLVTENKKLERQRTELLVAFKKQLKLIDVLKRQKVHLEAARALQFSESEFLATLELGAA